MVKGISFLPCTLEQKCLLYYWHMHMLHANLPSHRMFNVGTEPTPPHKEVGTIIQHNGILREMVCTL